MNLNKAVIIGNVTQDPELRTTPSGDQVANFTVATNRIWNDRQTQERQQKTEFHNVVAWRRLAEIAAQYLKKGSLVMIEGRIETRTWDGQDGKRNYKTEIIAENMQLGPKRDGGSSPSQNSENVSNNSKISKDEEEVPTIDADTPTDTDDEVDVKDIPF